MIKKCLDYYKKHEEIFNYLIIGGLTTLISLIVYYGCVYTFLNPQNPVELQIANIISWIVSVSFAYITNRIFVFKSKDKKIMNECIKFFGARILTLFLDMGLMALFVSLLHFNDKIIKIIVQVLVILLNYVFSKLFVFKKQH